MSETAAMRFTRALDLYIADQRAEGRINSPHTEREYRYVLSRHGDDVNNRDPAYTNREDVKQPLAHWTHPNTRSKHRSILVSSTTGWSRRAFVRATRPDRPSGPVAASRSGTD